MNYLVIERRLTDQRSSHKIANKKQSDEHDFANMENRESERPHDRGATDPGLRIGIESNKPRLPRSDPLEPFGASEDGAVGSRAGDTGRTIEAECCSDREAAAAADDGTPATDASGAAAASGSDRIL